MKTKPPLKTRILLVEDHAIVRQGVARLINQEADMSVCCEASNASDALQQIGRCHPDVVLTDISMKGMNGIELLKHLKYSIPSFPRWCSRCTTKHSTPSVLSAPERLPLS